MNTTPDPDAPKREFQQDVALDKPGIVGARWWHKGLLDEGPKVQRREVLSGLVKAGGVMATISLLGCCVSSVIAGAVSDGSSSWTPDATPDPTSVAQRHSLEMQKQFGWDFGARGVPLVFDGKTEEPFVRTQLDTLAAVMAAKADGPNAKYQVATLVESLVATPTSTLPDPQDGAPKPDAAPFQPLSAVLVPICTPAMLAAYRSGEALVRLVGTRSGLSVLVDLAGPEAVAFAAGAATAFEPVLLLDNWPHPYGVVPSHLTLAALAYYQPRFVAAQKERVSSAPLFVLDRGRLAGYTEANNKFDNRYYARAPKLDALAKDGARLLFYVVPSPADLPEPEDLSSALSAAPAFASADTVQVRALALSDLKADPAQADPAQAGKLLYGGTTESDARFWDDYAPTAVAPPPSSTPAHGFSHAHHYHFAPRTLVYATPPPNHGHVPVIVTHQGMVLSAALDRSGSMNRFAGGWSG